MSTTKRLLSLVIAAVAAAVAAAVITAAPAYASPEAGGIPGSGLLTEGSPGDGEEPEPYTIIPAPDPVTPVVILDPPIISCSDMPEANYVSVHIYPPTGIQLSENDRIVYRFEGEEQWSEYKDQIEVRKNGVLHALVMFADGSKSPEATVAISSIDMTPPTAPTVKADFKTWVKDKLTIELEPGTDEQSGYLRSEYRIGSDGQWTEYTGAFNVTANGVLYVRGSDKAGNYSEEASVKITNFDTTAPVVAGANVILSSPSGYASSESSTFPKIFKGDVSFSVSGIRDDESGVAYYEYQAAGSTSSLKDNGWKRCEIKDSPTIKGDFCGYVFIRAADKVGNVSANMTSEGFIIDTTPPAISDIALSPSTLTEGRVTIKFSVTDNSQISEVTVNGAYVGAYATSYTVYRNGDYVIRAVDAAGNVASRGVTVNNINSTPFTLVKTFEGLDENSYTPSSWAEAKAAATALQGKLTVGASEDQISASYERLLAAMEALVPKGDGTASIALIGRINNDYNKDNYTESSWAVVELRMDELTKLLDEPERTQEQVDNARRALENALVDLVPRGNFDSLDALIAQCGTLDPEDYDKLKYNAMLEALEKAKGLSRADSSQDEIDSAYSLLLTSMVELKDAPRKESAGFTLVFFVILALLIIAVGTALFIVNRRRKAQQEPEDKDYEGEDSPEFDQQGYGAGYGAGYGNGYDDDGYVGASGQSVGDLYFTDEEEAADISEPPVKYSYRKYPSGDQAAEDYAQEEPAAEDAEAPAEDAADDGTLTGGAPAEEAPAEDTGSGEAAEEDGAAEQTAGSGQKPEAGANRQDGERSENEGAHRPGRKYGPSGSGYIGGGKRRH